MPPMSKWEFILSFLLLRDRLFPFFFFFAITNSVSIHTSVHTFWNTCAIALVGDTRSSMEGSGRYTFSLLGIGTWFLDNSVEKYLLPPHPHQYLVFSDLQLEKKWFPYIVSSQSVLLPIFSWTSCSWNLSYLSTLNDKSTQDLLCSGCSRCHLSGFPAAATLCPHRVSFAPALEDLSRVGSEALFSPDRMLWNMQQLSCWKGRSLLRYYPSAWTNEVYLILSI